MPELPDVEVMRQYAEEHAMDRKVTGIEYKDSKEILESTKQKISRNIKSERFTDSRREGKHLLLKTKSGKWLAMHFGMTGDLKYFRTGKDEPEYSKLILHFDNGHSLSYISGRKLGKISITDDPEAYKSDLDIGIDALKCSFGEFRDALEGKRGSIKNVLMDQSRVAGIGNIYSDEILYQEKLHPKYRFEKLDEKGLKSLHSTIRRALKTAINHNADPSDLPGHYLLPHRNEGEKCPDCKGKIKKIKINGRGTFICPQCQKKK